jgi:hypothetical protein
VCGGKDTNLVSLVCLLMEGRKQRREGEGKELLKKALKTDNEARC